MSRRKVMAVVVTMVIAAGVSAVIIWQRASPHSTTASDRSILRPGIDDPSEPKTELADGVSERQVVRGEYSFRVVHIDLTRADLRLFWKRPDGTRYGTFKNLESELRRDGERLIFATNSGIFDPTFTPCGMHIGQGANRTTLNLADGDGNFYLKPNGVFFIDDAGGHIVNSETFPKVSQNVRLATQSGPLLLSGQVINVKLRADSTSRRIRSGVGVVGAHDVYFAISASPVTFHEFATLFRDDLRCTAALYLDGVISRFHVPGREAVEKADGDFAGILGVVSPLNSEVGSGRKH